MIISEEDYFEHHGIKGMRWGVRRKHDNSNQISRRESKKELHTVNKQNASRQKVASDKARQDPTFKREVKLTRKHKGIDIVKLGKMEVTKRGGVLTNKFIQGEFVNSKGENVSTDFANTVLRTVTHRADVKRKIAAGALFAASVAAPLLIRKL